MNGTVRRPRIAVYRLFDLAEEVDLGQLALERLRLFRARRGAVKFERPPATADLGDQTVDDRSGRLTARIYEFGVCVLRWSVDLEDGAGRVDWSELFEAADGIIEARALEPFFEEQLRRLEAMIAPALIRPVEVRLREEFAVIHLEGVEPADRPAAELLDRPETAALVLGEREELSVSVRRELEQYAFGYGRRDLAVLGFDRVLIVDPEGIWDVADLVELAHAELIELGYYHRILQRELESLPGLLARRPGFFRSLAGRRDARLMQGLMARHAEIT
ncbi:MAG: hypothetical protein PVG07_15990, partial [Acidobacteriota bacterium]